MFTPRTMEELNRDWPPELDHISANSLKTFARCPEVWRRVYCLGERQRPAAAIIWGRADHVAIAADYSYAITAGEHLSTGEVQDIFSDTFEVEINEGSITDIDFGKNKVLTPADAKKEAARVKDKGISLVAKYHTQVSPHVHPTEVEKEFEYSVPGTPVKLVGAIDLIASYEPTWATVAGVDHHPRLIDRKTSGRVPGEPSPEWLFQAKIYQLVEHLGHDWHLSVKTGSVLPTQLWIPASTKAQLGRTEQLVRQLVGQIGHLYWTYGPDHPWPGANVRGFMWGGHPCNFCGFRSTCAWW